MRRVVVTGVGVITGAGSGKVAFEEGLRRAAPAGSEEAVRLPRGRERLVRLARIPRLDPPEGIAPGALRRMSAQSRLALTAAVEAMRDARASSRPLPPERLGTYFGSGFGSLQTTVEYLTGIFREGMAAASPGLFAEALASAPAGHVAIALDARGPSQAFSAGDASAFVALGEARRSIAKGRIDRAVVTGFETMPPILVGLLTRVAARSAAPLFLGEGGAAIVLEEHEQAIASGAPILAEILGVATAGDPAARPQRWSADPDVWEIPMRRVAGAEPAIRAMARQAPPDPEGARAERAALERIAGGKPLEIVEAAPIFGGYAGAGSLSIVAAILSASKTGGACLASAGSWGGLTAAALFASAGG